MITVSSKGSPLSMALAVHLTSRFGVSAVALDLSP